MSTPRLSETSYIVLGLLERVQPATPYDLKRLARLSTVNFWSIPHAQLYKECARLAREGLLSEEQEQSGRRRRFYRLADRGNKALEAWRAEPIQTLEELRDPSILKLFFGSDPAKLACTLLPMHQARLEAYERYAKLSEELRAGGGDVPQGAWLALQAGIGHEREYVRFWKGVLDEDPD